MGRSLWNTASGRDRRWVKRKDVYSPAPKYVRVVVVLLAAGLVGTLAWQGIQSLLHPAPKIPAITLPNSANFGARTGTVPGNDAVTAWESDVADALQTAAAQGTAGDITAAEVEVDRAASIVISARMQGQRPSHEFGARSIAALDRVLQTRPDNSRLFEHVTLARIELANQRSSEQGTENGSTPGPEASNSAAYPGDAAVPAPNVGPEAKAPHAIAVPGHVVLASPRAIAAQSVLDRASLGGNYLDATLMPETSEVLLPPSTRKFSDNVRVEGLTIEGASQTLDGVHWKNMTFVGMRLRYEGGEISLQNVKFIHCRFGFTTDENGAKLADAITLGKSSIEIQ